jgi:hypothetical protein
MIGAQFFSAHHKENGNKDKNQTNMKVARDKAH